MQGLDGVYILAVCAFWHSGPTGLFHGLLEYFLDRFSHGTSFACQDSENWLLLLLIATRSTRMTFSTQRFCWAWLWLVGLLRLTETGF